MSIIPVKCPHCGQDLKVELTDISVCTNCGKEFDTDKGSKYYKSIKKLNTENKKVAKAEQYAKVDGILEQADFYLKEKDYASAEKLYKDALFISTVDYRIYLGLVYVKTKTFTDLEDTEHFKYLNEAIECANEEAKEYIRKLYAPYHSKRAIPKEEREEYLKQERDSRYKKVEILLKDSIPKHFERERSLKLLLILFFASLVATATLIALGLWLDIDLLTIASSIFAIISVIVLSSYFTTKSKVALFNAVLDFYDNYPKFNLKEQAQVKVLKRLEFIAVSYINNEGPTAFSLTIEKLVEECLKNSTEELITYLNSDKVLSSYIEEE